MENEHSLIGHNDRNQLHFFKKGMINPCSFLGQTIKALPDIQRNQYDRNLRTKSINYNSQSDNQDLKPKQVKSALPTIKLLKNKSSKLELP